MLNPIIYNQLSLTIWLEKRLGKKDTIVFTNGCFDIIHQGHLDLLECAKKLGDILIVGMNSDHSVQQLKGPTRPIKDQETRARILSSFAFVDLVVVFNNETPEELIHILQPDILVKGGDYTEQEIVGASWVKSNGGKVKVIPFRSGVSSSHYIDKIKKT